MQVPDDQYRAWKLAALGAGLSISEWVRQQCEPRTLSSDDRVVLAELRKLVARLDQPGRQHATVGPGTAQGQSITFDDPDAWTALLAPSPSPQRPSSVPPSTPDSVAQLPGDPKGKSPRDMTEQEFAAWRATVDAEARAEQAQAEQQQQATD